MYRVHFRSVWTGLNPPPSPYGCYIYRPQRSWGKFIFSQASVILSRGSTWAGTPPATRYTLLDQVHPQTRYTPPGTRYTPRGPGTPSRTSACREIRATSGRYASYWNAILLPCAIRLIKLSWSVACLLRIAWGLMDEDVFLCTTPWFR